MPENDPTRGVPPGPKGENMRPSSSDSGAREPRFEVHRAEPAASPEPGLDSSGHQARVEDGEGGVQGASEARSSGISSVQQEPRTPRARKDGSLLRSPIILLALLALVLLAGVFGYTAIQGASDGDPGEDEVAQRSEASEIAGASERYYESSPDPEPPMDVAEQEIEFERPSPPEPREVATADTAGTPDPEASIPSEAAAARDPNPAEETIAAKASASTEGSSAVGTARAFYAALSAGDGASAAQLVVPDKRQRGPLSAGELTRYFSSFRRPLRVRRMTPVDSDTVRVAYDYVLPDGRLCQGLATVHLVQSGDRSLVRGIRARGPC